MSDITVIKTTKIVYPQIYAYVLPEYKPNEGWVKIGYTEQRDVKKRINQQLQTSQVLYSMLWSEPAKYIGSDEWFFDKQLHAYLRKFKGIEQRPNTEWFYYDGIPEQAHVHFDEFRHRRLRPTGTELEYLLRAEQEAAVAMTLEYAQTHEGGEFLWNAKPRFGKTLTAYDLARRMDAQQVLIVTNRPAIANSWFDDFKTFIAWQTDYRFVSTTDSLKERHVLTREKFLDVLFTPEGENARCISFISLQDLKGAISFGGMYNKLKWVKDLEWDLLVIDEAHEGVDTFKTDVAFNNIKRKFTLHLSGTPFKAVASGRFSEDQIFNWTYTDEQEAKSLWPIESEENNPYESLPRLNLFSYQMSQMITDEVNRGAEIDGKDIDFAFDLNEFFATGENGKFIHETEVKKWLDTLARNEKYPFSTKELRAELKHTFWLLNRVASAKALEKKLREHPVFENYEIILAAGDGRIEDDQVIEQRSLDRVREAIKSHDRTITLSVGQLTTGVTVPEWTAVLMLSNVKSPSLYMQAAFRAQNQWSYTVNGEKRRKGNAYVFDFAPERTLIIYDEFANNLNGKTVGGGGTTDDRETNIRKLLNFFPVIAEDDDGKMVELDVRQVLTIPKTIKAQEVVKRGFISNLLFQNISGIFASAEAREILEKLNPMPPGKVMPSQKGSAIDTQSVQVDNDGNAVVAPEIVISETAARFGDKVYADITDIASHVAEQPSSDLTSVVASAFTRGVLETAKEIARDNSIAIAQAEQVVRQNANVLAREVEIVKKQADIRQAEAKVEYENVLATATSDPNAIAAAKARYETTKQKISDDLKQEIVNTVEAKTVELTRKSTEDILQKTEEKKKTKVEDDIRARLRGFARTIPSFLMAYGESSTTLSNFDSNIQDSVFKEVTGITLDQFRALRDTYNFFDAVVFDESVQEFLHKKEKLANYFDDSQTEDIFDYIPPQKTNQVFTPKWVVKLMIDKLEKENHDLFTAKDRTFADLYVKSGLYLTEIVKRLYTGLKDVIPDKDERLRHILEHQVYGFAPSKIIYNIARNYVFGGFPDISDSHLQCRDLTETAKKRGALDMKFDVVVGNPPYQETGEARDEPIYHFFYNLAEQVAPKYSLISPARFLFNAGQTPKGWNMKMLNDEHLKVEYYEQNSANIFPGTQIIGGITIIYRDNEEDFGSIGIFTHYDELNSIVSKTTKGSDEDFSSLVQPQGLFRFSEQFFTDYPQAEEMLGKGTKDKIVSKAFSQMDFAFHEKQTSSDEVRILGLDGAKRVFKWVKKVYLQEQASLSKHKVFISESNGASGTLGDSAARLISTPLIGEPYTAHTDTFLTVGSFYTESEAEAVLKYIKTKFTRVLLGVLKVTQHNSRSTWSKVPLQDFTPQSDIDWTKSIPEIDRQLYAKYGLDEKEIAFIEEKVKAMT